MSPTTDFEKLNFWSQASSVQVEPARKIWWISILAGDEKNQLDSLPRKNVDFLVKQTVQDSSYRNHHTYFLGVKGCSSAIPSDLCGRLLPGNFHQVTLYLGQPEKGSELGVASIYTMFPLQDLSVSPRSSVAIQI